ncbi:DUF2933 domain-containing protein [Guptibacillus hwajinpoensis]
MLLFVAFFFLFRESVKHFFNDFPFLI